MLVRRIIFTALATLLLFTSAAFAFPYDPNPSTIDAARFSGSWSARLASQSVDQMRIVQFMADEFRTPSAKFGGKSPYEFLDIWKTPTFTDPEKVRQNNATWEYVLNNPNVSPAASVGQSLMTTHDEMIAFFEAMPRINLTIEYFGEIPRGFPFPVLVFSKEKDRTPVGIRASGKPTIWVQGIIHGGEWSGGESVLALAYDLAHGRYDNYLNKVNVIIIPRINADGAKAPRRETADLVALQWTPTPENRDLNRDNVLLDLHVSRVMKKLYNLYHPHFWVD
ncbi:MAG: hypothetical protein FWE49_04935, partial [Synergistaceae bacterium]|nr:hypothetical protein [Synergistaceae bacterium]